MFLAVEQKIFPKRRKRSLEEFSVKSQFRKNSIIIHPPEPVQISQSIIIEVPNQSSFENQANSIQTNDVIKLPEVSKVSIPSNVIVHDTPDDRLKPPKNKSLSTPRRRSTHIRCLDFSTPQPKSNTRDQARSKLFCDTPKRCEKIVEESSSSLHESSSPLPKLQADWGSVNGFESIVQKETNKEISKRDWDSDIRDMVGAGILTSDADVRKSRKKKTPRKKIKPIKDKISSELMSAEQNISGGSIKVNAQTGRIKKSFFSEDTSDLNEPNCSTLLQNDQNSLEVQSKISVVSLETSDKEKELCCNKLSSKTCKSSNERKLLKTQNESSNLLEIPLDKPFDFYSEPFSVDESNSLRNLSVVKSVDKQNEIPISLETPDKINKLCDNQLSTESNSFKIINDTKLLEKQSKFPISLETPNKIIGVYNEKFIESNTLENACKTLNNPEQSETDIKEQNQLNVLTEANKSITTPTSEIMPEITNKVQEKDSNMLETFNNHNCIEQSSIKQTGKKSNERTECNNQNLLYQSDTNNLSELKSPIKFIQPNKQHNLVETPFKCDDAVDVPETPISKLLREYDPSKLVTPLPCTPVHYEDSLTETPLTKVFRETSYLNRPPISPFPPTPGNSMSVDTVFVPLEKDCSKTSNSNSVKVDDSKELLTQSCSVSVKNESSLKTNKIKPTPSKSKPKPSKHKPTPSKLSIKTKTKNSTKGKKIEAKKKQIYESVKVELFGSEISSNSTSDELETSIQEQKKIIINKKPQEEKKSGFKPIPKRNSVQSKSVNDIENCSLNECNTKFNESQSIKPTLVKIKKSSLEKTKNLPKIKQSNQCLKPMVHFDDDPVEKCVNLSTNPSLFKSINKNVFVTQNKTLSEVKSDQFIESTKCSNIKTLKCNRKDKKIEIIQSGIKTDKLNISNSSGSYSEKSNKKISVTSPCVLNSNKKTHDMSNQKTKLFENSIDKNKKSNVNEENNCISKNNTSNSSHDKSNRSESTITSRNSMNNTSCIIVENNESKISSKNYDNSFNNLEYLKITKVYEIINEDDEHEVCCILLHKIIQI